MKQIVVFDFDCTLTKEHLWNSLYDCVNKHTNKLLFYSDAKEWTENYIFGQHRIIFLKKLFSLLMDRNIDMAISSHGRINDITRALKHIDIEIQFFKYIHGRDKLLFTENNTLKTFYFDKCIFIKSFLLNIEKYDHVIYIDDCNQYYNKLKDTHEVTTIIMHNNTNNTNTNNTNTNNTNNTNDNGLNEEDCLNILKAVKIDNLESSQKL